MEVPPPVAGAGVFWDVLLPAACPVGAALEGAALGVCDVGAEGVGPSVVEDGAGVADDGAGGGGAVPVARVVGSGGGVARKARSRVELEIHANVEQVSMNKMAVTAVSFWRNPPAPRPPNTV